MRKISFCFLMALQIAATAQLTWIQKASLPQLATSGRKFAVGFSVNGLGYISTGGDGGNELNDLWQWNPTLNTWTQKATFPGIARQLAVGFSIGNYGYVGTGDDGFGAYFNDLYEYNPSANVWTQKASCSGAGRSGAAGFSIGTKGYIGMGYDGANHKQDFWEWDQTLNAWTQKMDFPGSAREQAAAFSIGSKGYVGPGYPMSSDFWEYDPGSNTWSQKANFPGINRYGAIGIAVNGKGYVGLGGDLSANYNKDFWRYDPALDTWAQQTDFSGTARQWAACFSIGAKGYIGTGEGDLGPLRDLWEFTPGGSGIEEYGYSDIITVYPNPFVTEASVKSKNIFKNASLAIYSIAGQKMKEIENISGDTFILHRDNLPGGMYVIQVTEDGNILGRENFIIGNN